MLNEVPQAKRIEMLEAKVVFLSNATKEHSVLRRAELVEDSDALNEWIFAKKASALDCGMHIKASIRPLTLLVSMQSDNVVQEGDWRTWGG